MNSTFPYTTAVALDSGAKKFIVTKRSYHHSLARGFDQLIDTRTHMDRGTSVTIGRVLDFA